MSLKHVIVAMSLAAVGCVHNVNVALRPDYGAGIRSGQALAMVTPGAVFYRGEFSDKRPDPTKLASFQQGVHTYNLTEERPMADALFEGLKAEFAASKQRWSETATGDVKVNLTFLSMSAARNAGFVKVGASATIQMKADFVNAKTGDVIYSNVYSGNDARDQAMIGLMGLVKSSIDAAILRCVQSVGDDAALAKALAKPR